MGLLQDRIINFTKCREYTGIDINVRIKNYGIKNIKKKLHIVDITTCWKKQISKMNELFYPINFDVILLINSIHFCYKNIQQLFANINKIRKQNTIVIVKFLNRDFLDNFDEIIKYDTNFVKKLPNNMIKYYYSHVHKVPQTEYVFSDIELIDLFYNNHFEVKDIFHFHKNNDKSWENYLNSFSIIIFKSVL